MIILEHAENSPINWLSNFEVESEITDPDIGNDIKFEDAYNTSDFNPFVSMVNERICEVSKDEVSFNLICLFNKYWKS